MASQGYFLVLLNFSCLPVDWLVARTAAETHAKAAESHGDLLASRLVGKIVGLEEQVEILAKVEGGNQIEKKRRAAKKIDWKIEIPQLIFTQKLNRRTQHSAFVTEKC